MTEPIETAASLRSQAAELLRKSVAIDRATAAADRAAESDPMRQFAAKLFAAAAEDE